MENKEIQLKLIDRIFNEITGDGDIARGWVPWCDKEDCDCLYHSLKNFEEKLKMEVNEVLIRKPVEVSQTVSLFGCPICNRRYYEYNSAMWCCQKGVN